MQLSNITKSYGEKKVLDGFNAVIEDGRVNWLMGSSGAGKTTLLRIIAGLEPYEGEITDKPVCAFMFQENRLLEQLSAVDNIVLTGVQRDKAVSCLLSAGISERDIHMPLTGFSGGMKRRVAMLRALLYPKAQLVLMDEPFNGLDENNRVVMAGLAEQLRAGRTVIAVTHHISDTELLKGNILYLQPLDRVMKNAQKN